jgi:hypothetical protein
VAKQWQQIQAAQIWSRWNNYLWEIRLAKDYQHLHKHKLNEAVKSATSGTGWYGKPIYRKLGDLLLVTVPSKVAPITDSKSSALLVSCCFNITYTSRYARDVQIGPEAHSASCTMLKGAGVWCLTPISFFSLVVVALELQMCVLSVSVWARYGVSYIRHVTGIREAKRRESAAHKQGRISKWLRLFMRLLGVQRDILGITF